MKTGEAGLRPRAVLPSEAAFRARQQPHRGRREAACHTRRSPASLPNRALAVHSARNARGRSLIQYDYESERGVVF
jgi:hypothetical protein